MLRKLLPLALLGLLALPALGQRGFRGGGVSIRSGGHSGFRGGGFHGGFRGGFHGSFRGGAFHGGGFRGGGFRGSFGFGRGVFRRPGFFGHRPFFGHFGRHHSFFGGFGFRSPFFYGGFGLGPAYPIVYSDVYAYSYPPPYAYTPAPNVIVVVPPAAPLPQVRNRPDPAQPDIQEIDDRYWQRRRESAARTPEQISFRLALKDGTVETGVAYWVEGESLHYITTQGRHKEVPLGEVDREASERLNRNGQIEFKLPPARD